MKISLNGEEVTEQELAQRIRLPDPHPIGEALVLPGRPFALAWLAVSLAASSDKDRYSLYRRVLVDVHPFGVTLAATDSFWLARAFVPFDSAAVSSPPSLDEVVPESFVIADVEHRIRDLMKYVERITRKLDEDNELEVAPMLVVSRRREFDPDVPSLDPTLSAPQVVVEIPGEERIVARESEIEYPNLAKLAKFQPKTATKLLFAPGLMGRVSDACTRIGAPGLQLTPTSSGSVSWQAALTSADLGGVLMPLRDDDEEGPV